MFDKKKKKMKFLGPLQQEDDVTAAPAAGALGDSQTIQTGSLTTRVISEQGNLCRLLQDSETVISMPL